jgi:hypothetical protein
MHRRLLLLPLSHRLLSSLLVRAMSHLLPLAFPGIDMSNEPRSPRSNLALVSSNVDERLSRHAGHILLITG